VKEISRGKERKHEKERQTKANIRIGKTSNRRKRKKRKKTEMNRREVIRYRMTRRSMGICKRRKKIEKNKERKRGTDIGEGYECVKDYAHSFPFVVRLLKYRSRSRGQTAAVGGRLCALGV
jgi:hypothetical protein